MAWLVRGDDVLASAELATSRATRRKGLIGRSDIAYALVLRPCRHVHTFGMRVPIDIVFCDSEGTVLGTQTLRPRRFSRLVAGTTQIVEASVGSVDRWQLAVGDRIEVRE